MDRFERGLDEFDVADRFDSDAQEEFREAAVDRRDGVRDLNKANRLGRRFRDTGNFSDEIARIDNIQGASDEFRNANRHAAKGKFLKNMAARNRSAGRRDINAAGREFSEKRPSTRNLMKRPHLSGPYNKRNHSHRSRSRQ